MYMLINPIIEKIRVRLIVPLYANKKAKNRIDTLIALQPSYTFTTTFPLSKIETFGSIAEDKILTF